MHACSLPNGGFQHYASSVFLCFTPIYYIYTAKCEVQGKVKVRAQNASIVIRQLYSAALLKTQHQTVQSTHKEWSFFYNRFPKHNTTSEKVKVSA